MSHRLLQRIAGLPVLPETRTALALFVEQDWNSSQAINERLRFQAVLETVYYTFSGDAQSFQPFSVAWIILRAALLRLDHIQDNDSEFLSDPSLSPSEHYNLVFTYYVLAGAILDDLDDTIIPVRRIRRLMRMWNDNMLWAASGQQRDLATQGLKDQLETTPEYYQEAIEAKAGAVYALGFGGAGVLATDDQRVVAILSHIGQLYGLLLQFSDDFLDSTSQIEPALTLPHVYATARTASGLALPEHDLQHYWNHIYKGYFKQVEGLLKPLPAEVQTAVLGVFRSTFAT